MTTSKDQEYEKRAVEIIYAARAKAKEARHGHNCLSRATRADLRARAQEKVAERLSDLRRQIAELNGTVSAWCREAWKEEAKRLRGHLKSELKEIQAWKMAELEKANKETGGGYV